MLEALLRAAPDFLSAEDLLEQVWDEHADPFTNAVFITISRHAGLPARSHHVPVAQVKAFDEHIGQMFAHFNDDPDGPPDIASLRAEHPGLMDLATWLHSVQWRP